MWVSFGTNGLVEFVCCLLCRVCSSFECGNINILIVATVYGMVNGPARLRNARISCGVGACDNVGVIIAFEIVIWQVIP